MPNGAISFPILGDGYINPSRYISIGNFKIYWYGVIIAAGFVLAVIYACKRSRQFGLTPDNIYDVIIYGLPAAVICARIYYVVFNWGLYRDNPSEIIKIWHGGLGMYGVVIGAALTLIIYCKKHKIPIGAMLDLVSIGFLIGQCLGRWGNFMNREAYGYVTGLPWRMGLTINGTTSYVHPTFLYESLWTFTGFIILHFWSKKSRRYDGQIAAMYVAWYGFGRMLVEGLRTDSLYLFSTGIRVSQLLAGVSCIAAIAYLIINLVKIEHRPEDLYAYKMAGFFAESKKQDNEPYDLYKDEELFGKAPEKSDAADKQPLETADVNAENAKQDTSASDSGKMKAAEESAPADSEQ